MVCAYLFAISKFLFADMAVGGGSPDKVPVFSVCRVVV